MYVLPSQNAAVQVAPGNAPGQGQVSLPDVAGGGAQSTNQDLPTIDLSWVETKSKKAALKVNIQFILFLNFYLIENIYFNLFFFYLSLKNSILILKIINRIRLKKVSVVAMMISGIII